MRFTASLLLCLLASRLLALPAFPGAEGAGANTLGGRGGTVYHVVNTNDSGAGSLRDAVSAPNRTVVFDISGTIYLNTDLKITVSNLTVAGQTAPGDGITLARRLTSVQNTRNVIMRYLRCRPGDLDSNFQDDAFHFVNATNCIADHLSTSWSVDECLSTTWSTNITVQWCMLSESLRLSQHDKGAHGYGTLLRYGYGQLTYHHNLYQHHDSRNPRLGDNLKFDFVNNVVYNWGGRAGYSGNNTAASDLADNPNGFTNYLNCVNNYYVAGNSSGTPNTAFASGSDKTFIYQSGNYIDSDKDNLTDGSATGTAMFAGFPYTTNASPYPLSAITTNSAPEAFQRVIAFAGASAVRDEPDLRLLGTVRSHNGRLVDAVGPNSQLTDYVTNNINGTNYVFVRGWPVLNSTSTPTDTDQDGMPDYWEKNLGLNPSVANNNHVNTDGYTDLENYLNWLADLHAWGRVNHTNTANLRVLTSNGTNLIFTMAGASNGIVSLAGDGYTAQFFPSTNYVGLASFAFNASNVVDHVAFGPLIVTLFITNEPPVIVAQPTPQTNTVGANVQFAVAAANAGLTYQWRRGGTNLVNGTKFSGVTNAALVITNITAADATNYTVVITNFSGSVTSSPAALVVMPPANTPPKLNAISNLVLIAGTTIAFTNSASDTDAPPQTLTFSGLNFPGGATVNTSNGLFNWRPTIAQGGVTNSLKIVVADNGSPSLSATQAFTISVLNPMRPQLQASTLILPFSLSITGSPGPDYIIRASTNLVDWTALFTNTPATMPFDWTDTATMNFNQRFYEIQLGP